MFFTHLSRIVAVLGFGFGCFFAWHGYLDYTREYLGSVDSTGAVTGPITKEELASIRRFANKTFEDGVSMILISMVLGILAEISLSLRKRNDQSGSAG
jgi:hypothetical protein